MRPGRIEVKMILSVYLKRYFQCFYRLSARYWIFMAEKLYMLSWTEYWWQLAQPCRDTPDTDDVKIIRWFLIGIPGLCLPSLGLVSSCIMYYSTVHGGRRTHAAAVGYLSRIHSAWATFGNLLQVVPIESLPFQFGEQSGTNPLYKVFWNVSSSRYAHFKSYARSPRQNLLFLSHTI
jgi:hypothetical protein